jgi:hypothetical protein
MTSKKKKKKADDPKKTKSPSSKKASSGATVRTNHNAAATEALATQKPQRAASDKKNVAVLGYSTRDVALRAYYIAEHRQNLNLPGDELGDWVEAERQLRKETGTKLA